MEDKKDNGSEFFDFAVVEIGRIWKDQIYVYWYEPKTRDPETKWLPWRHAEGYRPIHPQAVLF